MATTDHHETPVTRPALKVLQADQRALIDPEAADGAESALRSGFKDRRRLIEWYQRAVVRTFGEFAETLTPDQLARDDTLLALTIVDERERRRFVEDTPEPAVAADYRRGLEEHFLLPACNSAYTTLRKVAGEYGDEPDEEVPTASAPGEQQYLAMRPGFAQKDEEQATALRRLWGGFPDRDALRDWLHGLNEPTYGAVESDLPGRVMSDRVAVRHLVGNGVPGWKARLYRGRFAIGKLLPAFVAGIQEMDSIELASTTTDDTYIPSG